MNAQQQQSPGQILGGCAVIIVLLLGGFWLLGTIFGGDEPAPSTAAAPAPAGSAPLTGAALDEQLDLLFVAGLQASDVPVPDQRGAVAAAQVACAAFADGADLESFGGGFARDSGLTLEQTGAFIGVAVSVYCPEHSDAVGL